MIFCNYKTYCRRKQMPLKVIVTARHDNMMTQPLTAVRYILSFPEGPRELQCESFLKDAMQLR